MAGNWESKSQTMAEEKKEFQKKGETISPWGAGPTWSPREVTSDHKNFADSAVRRLRAEPQNQRVRGVQVSCLWPGTLRTEVTVEGTERITWFCSNISVSFGLNMDTELLPQEVLSCSLQMRLRCLKDRLNASYRASVLPATQGLLRTETTEALSLLAPLYPAHIVTLRVPHS